MSEIEFPAFQVACWFSSLIMLFLFHRKLKEAASYHYPRQQDTRPILLRAFGTIMLATLPDLYSLFRQF